MPTKQLSAGQKFLNMSVPNCGAYVKKIKACFVCFDPGDRGANCKWKNSQKCNESDGTSECGALHNKILHGCGVEYCQYHTTVTKTSSDGMVLFEAQEVDMPGVTTPVLVLHDPCALATLV